MECGFQRETNDAKIHDLSNAFMFTEEQITKQLVDMREQTDFMRKFRGALGIALREIKTLRTTATQDHTKHDIEGSIPRKRHSSCTLPSSSTDLQLAGTDLAPPSESTVSSSTSKHQPCFCADFGQADLTILREYLAKMTLTEGSDVGSNGIPPKIGENVKSSHQENVGKLKESGNLIENSIRHIEELKGHVAERNKAVIRLCQQLTQARLIRIRRETKLDEKLKEIREWKEKYEKLKKQNEKQVKITKGLRLTLNAEKQRVKTYENMARGLEETRRAFESLKSQAGQLMALLHEKDCEIAELTEKIEDLEATKSKDPYFAVEENMTSQNRMTSQIHGIASGNSYSLDAGSQTDFLNCDWCDRSRMEIDALRDKYDRLFADFEQYRRTHRAWEQCQRTSNSFSTPNNGPKSPLNHPYGRRRMHAPYTSPDSYRRVSRPPLRRRLSREDENPNKASNPANAQLHAANHHLHECLLSPIEEFGESYNQTRSGEVSNFTSEIVQNSHTHGEHEASTYVNATPNNHLSPVASQQEPIAITNDRNLLDKIHDLPISQKANAAVEISNPDFQKSPDELTMSPKHDSGISSIHDNDELLVQPSVKSKSSLEFPDHTSKMFTPETKTSYLEVGTCASPSPISSITSPHGAEDLDQPQLCLNSFIRYNDAEDTASEQSSLPHDDSDLGEEHTGENSMTNDPEMTPLSFGVVWHPALINSEAASQSSSGWHHNSAPDQDSVSNGTASNPLLRHNGVVTVQGATTQKSKRSGRKSRCVTYKGHKIDVTDFSIHAFRDIIWSLDGGPNSADDFIKFLASLAKKLNASPKWAGKHSMGSPEDWLALRGLY